MNKPKILITGSSGKLGSQLVKYFPDSLTPSKYEMDITKVDEVERYFESNKVDLIIHCAALASVNISEKNSQAAIETNIIGTSNLAIEAAKQNARFVYISTDYVYPCKSGPYKEEDPAIPFTVYGWTKLGGECAAKSVKNHCVIRTSFFDPGNIPFEDAPIDAFYSKLPLLELAEAVRDLSMSGFIGTINVGQERASAFEILKKHKPEIKPISIKDMEFSRAVDSSMDITRWGNFKKNGD